MSNLRNPLVIGGIICFFVTIGLGWIHTSAIKERNAVEREKTLSEERISAARLQQETDMQAMKLEAEREAAALKAVVDADAADQKRLQTERAAYKARSEQYRKECKAVQEKNQANFTNFMSACTNYNTQEYCINSEVGRLFADDFDPKWIQDCIDSKMETGW